MVLRYSVSARAPLSEMWFSTRLQSGHMVMMKEILVDMYLRVSNDCALNSPGAISITPLSPILFWYSLVVHSQWVTQFRKDVLTQSTPVL